MKFPEGVLTQWQVKHAFQLDPAPPKPEELNDLIVKAVREKDMQYFAQFLHHFEPRLNRYVKRFFLKEGFFGYDPERFLDYKLNAVWFLLECLQNYDPDRETIFLKYAKYYIYNSFLQCRMMTEAGSYENLTEYKNIRRAAYLYHEARDNPKQATKDFAEDRGCSEETAEKYVTMARRNRRFGSIYKNFTEEDYDDGSAESLEVIVADNGWNEFGTFWNSEEERTIREAFCKLSYKDQYYLENRNAICMTCDRVSDLSSRMPFETLAWKFENGSNSGAERAYRRAVDSLTEQLVFADCIHVVELRKKKKAAAVYEYRADCDGEWGEIQFDRKAGTGKILRLADGDYVKTHLFAQTAIRHILSLPDRKLLNEYLIPFRMDAPRFTLEKMIRQLVNEGKTNAVVLRQKFKPSKNAAVVVYEYCADFDDCWGKLEIDLKKKTGKILTLAEGDTMKSNAYANTAIQKILTMETDTIPRKLTIPFRRW